MCRLFGLSAGTQRVDATFWLLDAPDSLRSQSHRNPDGTGLGTFDAAGRPLVEKEPIAAYDDASFAAEARTRTSATFLAHVRRSSGTALTVENTHPFAADVALPGGTVPCLFAHNGVIGDIPALDAHLGADLARVGGQTDSERLFALICREAEAAGELRAGIIAAARWCAAHLPIISANLILTTADSMFALRYPGTHELFLLDRRHPHAALHHMSRMGTRVHSEHLAAAPAVVIASEPLDGEDWQPLAPGELLSIDAGLAIDRAQVLPREAPAGHPEHTPPGRS